MATSTNLTPSQRQTRSRLASHASWARTEDRTARTEPGRQAMLRRFEREVDPDNKLAPAERARRVESARKEYYTRLSLKASQARRRRAGAPRPLAADEGASVP